MHALRGAQAPAAQYLRSPMHARKVFFNARKTFERGPKATERSERKSTRAPKGGKRWTVISFAPRRRLYQIVELTRVV